MCAECGLEDPEISEDKDEKDLETSWKTMFSSCMSWNVRT